MMKPTDLPQVLSDTEIVAAIEGAGIPLAYADAERDLRVVRAVLATGCALAAQPVAWLRYRSDGGIEGPILDSSKDMCDARRKSGAWTPLYPPHSAKEAASTTAVMVDMVPPATARDRWMYEQGRLAERDPRSHAGSVAQPVCDFFPVAGRLALELECLLLDARDTAVQSKWWDTAHEALQQFRGASDKQARTILSREAEMAEAAQARILPSFDVATQGAIERAKEDRQAFETRARRESAMLILTPVGKDMRCADGRFPATYLNPETETAWRAWANKPPTQAAAPQASQACNALRPDFEAIRDMRIGEMTPAQRDDSLEAWLRNNLGYIMPDYNRDHMAFLLCRLNEARNLAERQAAQEAAPQLVKEDRNTILAALRFYQQHGMGEPANRDDAIHDIATNGGEDISYDDGDIDALCERINCLHA